MLMVVLGAGASYDSVPSKLAAKANRQMRPPLANELFASRGPFAEILARYPACHPVVPLLQRLPRGITLESRLEELQAESSKYPERLKQLLAIRFYLQELLRVCGANWHQGAKGITNYLTLLDCIERWRRPTDRVSLVTFNYDLLLELALPTVGVQLNSLSGYVSHPAYQLFKLHGSVNWGRHVESAVIERKGSVAEVMHDLVGRAAELTISDNYALLNQNGQTEDGLALFPAIAIPVITKQHYECPAEHLATLKGNIPEIDRMLLVGWHAGEAHFLELLHTMLVGTPPTMIVAGRARDAAHVQANLQRALVPCNATVYDGGFTDCLVTRAVDEFLAH